MRFLDEIQSHKVRFLKHLTVMSVYMGLGFSLGIPGPTLLDLRQQVGSSLTGISYCLTSRAAGYAIGCMAMAYVYPRVNFQVATAATVTFAAFFTFLVPHLNSLEFLLADFFAIGLFLGFWEAGSNVFLLHLWGKETAPFMQSLHFMFGVGAMAIPLIAQPFLIIEDDEELMTGLTSNLTTSHAEIFRPQDVMLVYPYSFVGCYLLLTGLFNISVWYKYPETPEHPSRAVAGDETEKPVATRSKKWLKILLIILTAAFMHIYYGLQISFGSFLMTFAVQSDLKLSKKDGSLLSTLFWLTFTLFRIIVVTLLDKMRISNCLLTPFGNSNEVLLWIGVGIMGIGMSSVWASIFEFLESNFKVTSGIGSMVIISAIVGEFVFPVIISSFITDYPQVLLWVVLSCSLAITFLFCLMFITSKLLKRN